ncbi:MAG TPA: winged helix-turn-helix domain-containing protein, partial [Terriglobales bacterium]|nr:winged helix-turn-helix domain-containing protein [Terriglobales bacterium]
MSSQVSSGPVFRFGLFEADVARSTLTNGGLRVRIQDQPFRVLIVLLERAGEIVTREELRQRLWPDGTYVDFDGSLNAILKKLRAAIADDPDNPRFIETVPRRGYRFIAPVSNQHPESAPSAPNIVVPSAPAGDAVQAAQAAVGQDRARRRAFIQVLAVVVLAVLALAGWFAWQGKSAGRAGFASTAPRVHMRKSVAILGFRNLSGRA